MQRGRLQRCTCCISAADDRIYAEQPRSRGAHRSACATNSDCARTSMSFAQKGHSTIVETRAPHDCNLGTGPKPWPVAECTGSVDALPCMSAAIDSFGSQTVLVPGGSARAIARIHSSISSSDTHAMKSVVACSCRHRGVTTLPWPCMPLLHWEGTVHSAPRSLALLSGAPGSTPLLPQAHDLHLKVHILTHGNS
jgi:hypothetical protein